MFTITIGILPGSGGKEVTVREGTTLADIARTLDLTSRQLVVNGEAVPQLDWATYVVTDPNIEIFALAPAKGA